MKFTQRIKSAVNAFNKTENSFRDDPNNFLRYGNRNVPRLTGEDWSQVEMSDQDMYTGYSYAAIKKRANRAAVLGKHFLLTESDKKVSEAAKLKDEQVVHPYLKLIRESKDFSEKRFWHDISTYLDLEGVYYLMAVRAVDQNKDGTPKVGAVQSFKMLNPYEVRRVRNEKTGEVGGYVEHRNGLYREIPKEMIIEIRLLNPFSQDIPFSMTDAAKDSQYIIKQAGDYARQSINGNINAPGILTTEVMLEDHVFSNFVSRMKNHSKGEPLYGNGAGAINWQSMQLDLDKAALDKLNDINRSTLFSVAGVSDMLMGHQKAGTGREVSKTQKDEFTENAVIPQVEDIADALNLDYKRYYKEYETDKYEIVVDNPLESDREAELKDIEIREAEIDLTEKLVGIGFKRELATKYAHGEIDLEGLGDPTEKPEETTEDDEAGDTKKVAAPSEDDDPVKKNPEDGDKPIADKTDSKPSDKDSVSPTTASKNRFLAVNQIAAKDFPALYDGLEIDPRAIADTAYRGCIMMDTTKIPVAQFVKDAQADLLIKEGWGGGLAGEDSAHVTLLFGLLNNGNIWKSKVDMLLEGWKMDTVTIDHVGFFDLGDSKAVIAHLEKTPELVEANKRLTLLPNANTFSDYNPHITLAYITAEADVDKWVEALNKKYKGQVVRTKSLNYGDLPEKKTENDVDSTPNADTPAEDTHHNHVEASFAEAVEAHSDGLLPAGVLPFERANNALEDDLRDMVSLQESSLYQAAVKLEKDITQAVIEALQAGDISRAEELISEAQEESFIAEFTLILAGFYTLLFPIYAAQLLATRATTYGLRGLFEMNKAITDYINESARKAAESHVATVKKDLLAALENAFDKATEDELIKIITDKANAREPAVMKKLPDNPNAEDIEAAVRAGKFNSDPAYIRAQELASEGASRQMVIKALSVEFEHISKTRAKTIARHETSRVFNMSQYQADLQFLTQSGMLERAYKKLRSRSGDPCPVCQYLIAQPAIPFTKNFADFGSEITATYTKENGKTAVQKMPINYEAISAGNVHVNCQCEYVLIIKNEDGTVFNNFDPTQRRDKDGKWTKTGGGGADHEEKDHLQAFESHIRNKSFESFYAEDVDGNQIALKQGKEKHVEFSAEEMAMLRTYDGVVATHNHPSSASFSAEDLVFGSRINAKEIRVVSGKFDYSFKPSDNAWPSEEEINTEFERIADETIGEFAKHHEEGRISVDELVQLWSHKIMFEVAKQFGATYTKESVENE